MVVAYLDERGTDEEAFYYVGGVACSPAAVASLATWTREFKDRLRPGKDPNSWYVKGSGEWLDQAGKHKENRDEAFARWELFAEAIQSLTAAYTVHVCIVRRKRLISRFAGTNANVAQLKRAILRTALVPTLLSLRLTGADEAELYIDRIEDNQAEAFAWSFETINQICLAEGLPFRLARATNVPKDDFASDVASLNHPASCHTSSQILRSGRTHLRARSQAFRIRLRIAS
jgi:hypothetical protein